MSPLPLLLRCLLALALLVYGLPTFASSHAGHDDSAAIEVMGSDDAPCHTPAAEPESAVSDCCDGGGPACGCDCFQAAPGLVLAVMFSGSVLTGPGPQPAFAVSAPRPSVAPSLRPPIG